MIKNNSIRKQYSTVYQQQVQEICPFAINDLEQTIEPHNFLALQNSCQCNLCLQHKISQLEQEDCNVFKAVSKASTHWLKMLLDSLCLSGAKTLKLNIPDILFLERESLQTFQTNRKDGRLIKLSGTTPLKSLFHTLLRMRKEYKYTLQLNFNQKMLQSIDPDFMHITYFQKFVPPFFHDGMNNIDRVMQNKLKFKRYILHKNKKYEIQQIQQHKMNQKQPFCIVKYTDGNCQLFNQIQFQVYTLSSHTKLQQEIVYIQSYIKYKLQTQAIYYSEYTLNNNNLNQQLDKRAEEQVMVLIGALHKYQQGYTDLQTIDQITQEMMHKDPRKYVKLITYKIVHYLNMTSHIYIEHIKIKWIMNDLGNIYLQEIMEFQISQIAKRHIRYRLPPKDQVLQNISQTNNFVDYYKEMKRRKYNNTLRIKKMITGKPIEDVLEIMDPLSSNSMIQQKQEDESMGQYFQNKFKAKKEGRKSLIIRDKIQHNEKTRDNTRYKQVKDQINDVQSVKKRKERTKSVNINKWNFSKVGEKMNNYFTINNTCQVNKKDISRERTSKPRIFDKKPARRRCGSTVSTFKDTNGSFYNYSFRTIDFNLEKQIKN